MADERGVELRERTVRLLCSRSIGRVRLWGSNDGELPWERGTNENTNGLLRQFFPAGTEFQHVSRREIKRVQAMLNDRPRKILNWHSPAHAFHQLLHQDLECTLTPFSF